MKEVSCKAFSVLEETWTRDGHPVSELTEGIDCSIEHLRNKHERFDWSTFQSLFKNTRRRWSDNDYVRVGESTFELKAYRPIATIARLLFTPVDFYRYGHKPGGTVQQLFSCARFTVRDLDEHRLEVEYRLLPGYETDTAWFYIGLGSMRVSPLLLGLPRSDVDMTINGSSASYRIQYPKGGGALSFIRKFVAYPFAARTAAVELRDAYEELEHRYKELEGYRENLEARVKERTAELAAARDQLSETVEQLREAQAIRDRFFSNVNHEIRTPLSLISIGVDDVLARYETQLDDRARSSLELSLDGVQNLVGLVDELLLLAAGQEGKLTLQRSRYDLVDSAKRSVHAWSTLAADAGNDLVYSGPESLSGTFDRAALDS